MYFNPARLGSVVTPLNEEKQNKRSTSIVYFFYFQPVGIALPYCFVIVFVLWVEVSNYPLTPLLGLQTILQASHNVTRLLLVTTQKQAFK